MNRIAVIGAGIAGLTAAYRLRQFVPAADIVLIERSSRLGGKILTDRVNGFVIEGGPDSFLSSKPAGLELCRELGIEDRLQGTNETMRRTLVMANGQLYDLPEGLSGLVPSRLEPLQRSSLFSEAGKARLAEEPDIPAGPENGDESLASFVERRFGREIYDRLIEPLMAGIYAGNGEELSLEATFPQLRRFEREQGSVVRGVEAARRASNASGPSNPPFLTPISGMQEVVEALGGRLADLSHLLAINVETLRMSRTGYDVLFRDGSRLPVRAVVLAIPAAEAAKIVESLSPDLAQVLAGIPTISSATISFAFPSDALAVPLAGYGYIIPRRERRPVLAVTWTSSKFEHRAPTGTALIRCFVGRAGMQDAMRASDQALTELALEELRHTLGLTAAPLLLRIYRWPGGMPQYTLGHPDRLRAIERALANLGGLALAGSSYRGVGIPDCIASGQEAACRVASCLSPT